MIEKLIAPIQSATRLMAFVFGLNLVTFCSFAQECAYLPPGGPMKFGLLQVARVDVDSEVADSPIWLDDGRPVIGAQESSQGGYRRGAIWVYEPYGSLGQLESFILPPLPEIAQLTGDFGGRLASSGPWLAATAELTNGSGTVCLFEATGATNWTFRTNLLGNAAASDDRFGDGHRAIAMHGKWLAVIRYETSGRVHLYRVTEEGIWEERQQLVVPGFQTTAINNNTIVALHDDTLVVGLPQNGSSSFTGQAHVWHRDASDTWNYEANLTPTELAAADRYGTSLALGTNKIFVSSTAFDLTATNGGAIFLFERENGTWSETTRFAPTNLVAGQWIGSHIAYSSLNGEYLAEGSSSRLRMFQPTGVGSTWKQVSQGHSGRIFRDWESPAGTVKTYVYDQTNSAVRSLSVRAHQVLVGYNGISTLHEHGWHAVQAWHFSIDPPCSVRPVHILPIGAPRENHNRIGDSDADGLSDFAEIYFGTSTDSSNVLTAGLSAIVTNNQLVKVQWPRASDTNLLITAEPQWSTNLADWTGAGIELAKVGVEPDTGRDIMEVTLPNTNAAAYLRLQFNIPPPPEEP